LLWQIRLSKVQNLRALVYINDSEKTMPCDLNLNVDAKLR